MRPNKPRKHKSGRPPVVFDPGWVVASPHVERAEPTPVPAGAIFTSEIVRSFSAADGLRRGFNGKKPRDTTRSLDGTLYRLPNGDTYHVPRGRRNTINVKTKNKTREQVTRELALSLPSLHVGAND